MKRLYSIIFALLIAFGISINGADKAYGWGSATGDASDFRQLQETAIFFNNSGQTMSAGQVVILDLDGSGVAAASTLGAYVDLVNATADSVLVVGVVKSTSVADQRPVAVVTKGVIEAQCYDSSDAVTSGSAVGTAGSGKGVCGGGSNLGIALEAGPGTDSTTDPNIYLWVDPTGAD